MTVDQYALCPCGNGKKIKFCKCKDSLPELDRVMTMIEGRQIVPAIDRLNQVLGEHPDAAWALAIKGRLMIDLREYDALAENAERFVRLQPSNPLALAQRAASEIFRNQPEKATVTLLEALTESGRTVDSFVLDIASLLAFGLANAGLYLTSRAYVQLPLTAQGYESNQTAAMVFQELNRSENINHLLKAVPEPLPRDEDAPWGERFDEAVGLLRSNQILLAESKLQSLARTVPFEPCVLAGLLTCAIWRGDASAQTECLRKLSECESLDLHQRSIDLAMSWLVEPDMASISAPMLSITADIEKADETEIALDANSRFARLPNDLLQSLRASADDVPPRAAFQVLSAELPPTGTSITIQQVPIVLGMLLVHGKQTDRAARCEVLEVRPNLEQTVVSLLQSALGNLTWTTNTDRRIGLADLVQVPMAMLNDENQRREIARRQSEFTATHVGEYFAKTPLPCLGGKSLIDTASDPNTLLRRTALVRILENMETLEDYDNQVLDMVRQVAGVSKLAALELTTDEDVSLCPAYDLDRIDVTKLNTDGLLFLFQRCYLLDHGKGLRRVARRIVEVDLPDDVKTAKITAYTKLIEFATTPEEGTALLTEAKAYAKTHSLDQANLWLIELSHKLTFGDQAGFSNALRYIMDNYRNRPEVTARVQQLLMSLGLLRPDGTPRQATGAPVGLGETAKASSASGIWTPDGPAPAASSAESSRSKLWIPGMD